MSQLIILPETCLFCGSEKSNPYNFILKTNEGEKYFNISLCEKHKTKQSHEIQELIGSPEINMSAI